jgi:hypothetical protein
MAYMTGVVSMVQESRFQLTDDRGVFHLFTLSPTAAMEPAGLQALPRTQARVCVSYKAAPGTIGNIATALCLVP